jgi:nitrogen fixation protein FixH
MNWGHGIAIFYGIFMTAMLSLVYLCTQQNIELVTPNYYEQEIAYQQRIDEMKNAHQEPVSVEISAPQGAIKLHFSNQEPQNGKVVFFRPSDSKLDFEVPLSKEQVQHFALNQLKSGLWRMKIHWTTEKGNYFQEEVLNVP